MKTPLVTTRQAAERIDLPVTTFLRVYVRSGIIQPRACRVSDHANLYALTEVIRADGQRRTTLRQHAYTELARLLAS